MALTVGIQPARACVGGPSFGVAPAAVVLTGEIRSGPDSAGNRRIDVQRQYVGSVSSPLTLSASGLCNYERELLKPGQRVAIVTSTEPINGRRLDGSTTFVYLLDSDDAITFDLVGTTDSRGEPLEFATLMDILTFLGLPDAAMSVPGTDITPIGLALIAISGLLFVSRRSRTPAYST
jgi:hypothetical protein